MAFILILLLRAEKSYLTNRGEPKGYYSTHAIYNAVAQSVAVLQAHILETNNIKSFLFLFLEVKRFMTIKKYSKRPNS